MLVLVNSSVLCTVLASCLLTYRVEPGSIKLGNYFYETQYVSHGNCKKKLYSVTKNLKGRDKERIFEIKKIMTV